MTPEPAETPSHFETSTNSKLNGVLGVLKFGLAMCLICLVTMMFFLFSTTANSYRDLTQAHKNHYQAEHLIQSLYQSSATLTRLARSYVVTANPRFLELFKSVLGVRDGNIPAPDGNPLLHWDYSSVEGAPPQGTSNHFTAFENLNAMEILTPSERNALNSARWRSDVLAEYESKLMAQVSNQNHIPRYITGLFNDYYHHEKIAIMEDLKTAFQGVDQRLQEDVTKATGQVSAKTQTHFIVFCLCLFCGLLLLFVLFITKQRAISQLEEQIQSRTEHLNASLHELKYAQTQVKTLHGLIPICSYCHQIRNERGAWKRLEVYLVENSDATLSHGICPNCKEQAIAKLDETA